MEEAQHGNLLLSSGGHDKQHQRGGAAMLEKRLGRVGGLFRLPAHWTD